MKISIIVAADENNVIGKDNRLLWHISADLKRFKQLTTGYHLLMGRKTFDSIGKPLPNRTSIIITQQPDYQQKDCVIVHSPEDGIEYARSKGESELFIIGGGEIYKHTLPLADHIYLTRVHSKFEGDTFFPLIESDLWEITHEERHDAGDKNPYSFSFIDYSRKVRNT